MKAWMNAVTTLTGLKDNINGTMETQEAQAGIDRVVKMTETGCPFFDRCPLAIEITCEREIPPIRELGDGHAIECHRSEQEFLH